MPCSIHGGSSCGNGMEWNGKDLVGYTYIHIYVHTSKLVSAEKGKRKKKKKQSQATYQQAFSQ